MKTTGRNIITSGLAALFAVSMLGACGGDEGEKNPADVVAPGEVAKSSKARELHPAVSASDAKELAEDNRDFAFELYHVLSETEQGNLFYSPHSISIALAMTYGGAKGDTASEMADALEFGLGQDKLHPAFNALDLELAKRKDAKVDPEEGGKPFELSVVNALWGQTGYAFQDSYLDLLATNYGAGMNLLDFKTEAEPSRKKINKWVEDQTNNRIKELLPEGIVQPTTRLVLTNAIFFKAGWIHEFEKTATEKTPFTVSAGKTVQADMMSMNAALQYGEVDEHQIIELPYVGNEVSMVVILPEAGEFESFEADLDGDKIDEYIDALGAGSGTLKFPKFKFESDLPLNDPLKELGMEKAFTGEADFSGIDGTKNLSISAVLHKSFVAVDEEGTEAAAATAVIMGETSSPEVKHFEMTVDRPFVFVIRDKPTGAILFVGRVVDPS